MKMGNSLMQYVVNERASYCNLKRYVIVVLLVIPLANSALAADALYRCSDGTFTNRVERQCAPYESMGIVRVQRPSMEAAKSTMNGDEDNRRLLK
jgi:hypothetical protein